MYVKYYVFLLVPFTAHREMKIGLNKGKVIRNNLKCQVEIVLFFHSSLFIFVSFSSPFDAGVTNVSRFFLLICRNIRNLC